MEKKIKVLIADDNVLLCEIINNYLRTKSDIEVVDIVHDGVAACNKINELRPHVVVLDCAMPVLDGLGVLEKINSENLYKPVCIMLSGIRHDAVTKRAYDLGAEYYIIKPFDLDVLADRIRMFRGFETANSFNDANIDLADGNAARMSANIELSSRSDTIRADIFRNENDRSIVARNEYGPTATKPIDASIPSLTLEERVTNLLHEIGVPANIRGYRCLRSAIIITVRNLDLLHFVTKELYPSVAQQLNTTPSSVERAIRHAISLVWDHGNTSALNKLFGYSIETRRKRPSNSEFIALIADKFRLESRQSG
ncbi:MAG: response regulator [Clostridiales bacterium]|jgi:two-component system response regulator (stage 0 sporulation protein A)|nr:response regulator [Clostridiales bacterium]